MKKTLLSVIAGLAMVGTVSAAPSPEDVKKMCEKNPNKYVWVEKDKFCAPINPCDYYKVNYNVREAYCASELNDSFKYLPRIQEVREMILERYAKNVLKTGVKNIKTFTSDEGDVVIDTVTTSDGGYFAVAYDGKEEVGHPACLHWASNAYGYEFRSGKGSFYIPGLEDKSICRDITDFASLLCAGIEGGSVLPDTDSDICSSNY